MMLQSTHYLKCQRLSTTHHSLVQYPLQHVAVSRIVLEVINKNEHQDYHDEEFINNGYDDDDDDDDDYTDSYYDNDITRLEGISTTRRTISNNKNVSSMTSKLQLYFNNPSQYTAAHKLKWPKPSEILQSIKKKYKRNKKNKTINTNIFEGALMVGSFGLLVLSQVSYQMSVDHMHLSKSKHDGTPQVGHCVVAKTSQLSSGTITNETDLDLLVVLHQYKGLVPRHLYAVGIIRDKKKQRYHLLYSKVNAAIGTNKYGLTYYTPAKDGGAFDMPPLCSATYFPLPDLTYNKMMAVLVVEAINQKFIEMGRKPVATGPVECELNKIVIARKAYTESTPDEAYHNLIVSFNKLNHFSMVAYPVGYHFDHYYNENSEYLENKCNLTFKMNNHIGRGGSMVGHMYVYALLDWGTEAKKKAARKKAAAAKGLRSASSKKPRKTYNY